VNERTRFEKAEAGINNVLSERVAEMQEVVENERQKASSLVEQLNGAKNAINELARENNEKERLIRSL
jgi:hypothetical protein